MRKLCTVLLTLILLVSTLAACAGSQSGTLEGRKKDIEKAWLAKDGTELVWDSTDAAGARHYGTYNGYDILFIPKPTMNPGPIITSLRFSWDTIFVSSEPFRLYAYQDGEFRGLFYVYQDGLISDEQLSQIVLTHRVYEGRSSNPVATEDGT